MKPISRSAGRSVVAAAAYRLGERLHEVETDQTHDYRRRHGVTATFTCTPGTAPAWAHDSERLWNAAAAAETRKNSTLAREIELALPAAVTPEARAGIVRAMAQELASRYGVAVSAAIHAPGRGGDQRNHHAHILFTTRRLEADGFGKKTRVLDDRKTGPQEIAYLRSHACDLINAALEDAGSDERVDHRSFAARGIEQEPTKHLGPDASAMERRGEASERGAANREVTKRNQQFDELVDELAALDAEIAAEQERELNRRYGPADLPEPPLPEREVSAQADLTPGLAEQSPSPAQEPARQPRGGGALMRALRGFFRDATPELFDLPAKPTTPSLSVPFPIAYREPAKPAHQAELPDQVGDFLPPSDPTTAAAQVRSVAAQFRIEELDIGASKPEAPHPPQLDSAPRFGRAHDAMTAAEQLRLAVRPFLNAIRHVGGLPEVLANLVEDGLRWWHHATQHQAELGEQHHEPRRDTWRDRTRADREERDHDDELDFD